jgi:hypothetical protein
MVNYYLFDTPQQIQSQISQQIFQQIVSQISQQISQQNCFTNFHQISQQIYVPFL